MNLDKDRAFFSDAIRATAEHLGILPVYVEKDYWITCILQQLSRSRHADNVVWKGGTSLSKGYGIIDRFSSDIDIAVLAENLSGSQIKTLISKVSKVMAEGLTERQMEGETRKGSRYRRTFHYYDSTFSPQTRGMNLLGNYVIIEINAFANPYPYVRRTISSFITRFLQENGFVDLIARYDMAPFDVNVLDLRRTLCEKTVSLLRHSFAEPAQEGLRKKIRHFYDLHYLLHTDECKIYLQDGFFADFQQLVRHDQSVFDEPAKWSTALIRTSPLLTSFNELWDVLSVTYENELGQLAYHPIPDPSAIRSTIEAFLQFLRSTLNQRPDMA